MVPSVRRLFLGRAALDHNCIMDGTERDRHQAPLRRLPGRARTCWRAAPIAVLALGLWAWGPRETQAIEILRANPGEAASPSIAQGYRVYGLQAAKASGGNLRIDVAGKAAAGHEALAQLESGGTDIALVDPAHFPEIFPFNLLLRDLALIGADALVLGGAGTEFVLFHCPPCLAEFRKAGILPLAIAGKPAAYLAGRNRVAALDEMTGKRIAAPELFSRWVSRMGGTPVEQRPAGGGGGREPNPAAPPDGEIVTLSEFVGRRLWTTMPHVANLPIGTAGPVALFNVRKTAWADLGLGDRAALIVSAAHGLAAAMRAAQADEIAARTDLVNRAVTFQLPNTAMAARHVTIRNENVAAVSKAAERRGLIAAGELAERYAVLVRRWSGLVTKLDAGAAGLEDLLFQEIYSKIDARAFGI